MSKSNIGFTIIHLISDSRLFSWILFLFFRLMTYSFMMQFYVVDICIWRCFQFKVLFIIIYGIYILFLGEGSTLRYILSYKSRKRSLVQLFLVLRPMITKHTY